ncbi:sulfotransferase 1E1-like isoform X2 [Dermacentor variabilis]|uniref:sulfotransferase 1E1-like isoform X2 n=1 Tax=Dermacentor variabilis TaxID=34621 RepID=UPI003F5B3414
MPVCTEVTMVTGNGGCDRDATPGVVNYEADPVVVDGVAFLPLSDARLAREALSYEPRPGDVILATFPKSGTTWCQYLIWGIHNLGAVEEGSMPPVEDVLTQHFPYIDLLGTSSTVADRPPPRFIKTHLPADRVHRPSDGGAKYVVCLRNPFDVAVSYFHMRRGRRGLTRLPPDYGFDHFLDEFLSGGLVGGEPFGHARAWHDRSKVHDNVLLVYYEALKEDPRKVVLKLAEFLSSDAAARLSAEPALLERLLEQTSLERLRGLTAAENFAEGDFSRQHPTAALFRKGVVGDWRSHFNRDQERRFREAYDRALGATEMHDFWTEHVKSTG